MLEDLLASTTADKLLVASAVKLLSLPIDAARATVRKPGGNVDLLSNYSRNVGPADCSPRRFPAMRRPSLAASPGSEPVDRSKDSCLSISPPLPQFSTASIF